MGILGSGLQKRKPGNSNLRFRLLLQCSYSRGE